VVFREKGIAGATMEEVAQRAELSKGALYLYFASRDELFLALAVRPLDDLVARFERERASGARGLALLERLLRAHAASLAEHRDVFRLGIALRQERDLAAEQVPSEVCSVFRDRKAIVFREYVEAIEAAQREGTLRAEVEARLCATQFWASLMGAAILQVEADRGRILPDSVPPQVALAAMPALLVDAVRVRDAAPGTRARAVTETRPVQRAARVARGRRS
jgi:TetR/AcrR family transcriptional regulator